MSPHPRRFVRSYDARTQADRSENGLAHEHITMADEQASAILRGGIWGVFGANRTHRRVTGVTVTVSVKNSRDSGVAVASEWLRGHVAAEATRNRDRLKLGWTC
jgi:hypothetical protein